MNNERFIPFSKADLISLCIAHNDGDVEPVAFTQVCQLLSSIMHFKYHKTLEALKESYAPFDPNSDLKSLTSYSAEDIQQKQKQFASLFAEVLNAANFEQVTSKDLDDAMHETSLFNVRLAVEFDDFDEVVFYRRGTSERKETLRLLWGLRKKDIEFTHYDRVAVYIKFKDEAYFNRKKKKPFGFAPGATIIKLFQNVPKADLEMLFPNSEVRMRMIDKVFIGASALIGGAAVLITKLGASIVLLAALFSFWLGFKTETVVMSQEQLVALIIGIGVFMGFVFKEWSKFKNRKIRFMKALADNLYFKNLTNNAGVFHTLVDAAEEEDIKEAMLAYFFLVKHGQPMSAQTLDQTIEAWFKENTGSQIDFEVEDALSKLESLSLVMFDNQGFRAVPLESAKQILDRQWDNYFQY